jgi:ADP-heptose:LPS heptosyltransferase
MVIKEGESLPSFDLVCPIMSLPLAFKTTVKNIPASIPYLKVEKNRKTFWKKNLGKKTLPRIGIVWSGSMTNKIDNNPLAKRNIPLKQLRSIFDLPLEFHILQKEIRPEDEVTLKSLNNINNHQKELNNFSDTAALIQEMDLVISVCTSTAHLSGALGQHTWILLPYSADYRWMLNQNNSPWYPTVELFRKNKPLEWDGLISDVENKLKTKYLLN